MSTPNEPIHRIDRSRVLRYRACPRARYIEYHAGGLGLRSARMSVPLATGTFIHEGLSLLNQGLNLESAINKALSLYHKEADAALCAINVDLEHHKYTVKEQAALVEALIRVYALRGKPLLDAEHEILEVEQEYEIQTPVGIFMARLDGLLRKRSDGDLYVLSYKTDTGNRLDEKIADARVDLQGLTEPWVMEEVMARWLGSRGGGCHPDWPAWFEPYWQQRNAPPVAGVKMEWLIKGSWAEDKDATKPGFRYQESYLVRPWTRMGFSCPEYAWKYYVPCPGAGHKIPKADGRSWTCKGDVKQHGLGPSWTRVPIWECMPIKEWIEMLASGAVQPDAGDALEGCLYLPSPIYRNAEDQKNRISQMLFQERRVAEGLGLLNNPALDELIVKNETLNDYFPQDTQSCYHTFGGPCPNIPLCFEAGDRLVRIAEAQLNGYIPRKPHHVGEIKER